MKLHQLVESGPGRPEPRRERVAVDARQLRDLGNREAFELDQREDHALGLLELGGEREHVIERLICDRVFIRATPRLEVMRLFDGLVFAPTRP